MAASCQCGCGRTQIHARGLSNVCYERWLYHGKPAALPPPAPYLTGSVAAGALPGRIEDYQELRSRGLTRLHAAERIGVTVRTIERWEQRMREDVPA